MTVHEAELVGGVLVDAPDPWRTARDLASLLTSSHTDRRAASAVGLDPDLVAVLRRRFSGDRDRIEEACNLGAAWVMGRRSIVITEPWDLVASLPAGVPLPTGLRRTTGETLVQLVTQASRTLRLVAPFIDRTGLSFLADALAAATARGVRLEVLVPTRSTHAGDALDDLHTTITRDGDIANFRVAALRHGAPWAHLKVLTSDSEAAYIGSANVTGAAIAGPNLELGILVRGPTVAVVERMLDLFRA
jgi:phosphatidylserine/phosphatidylglycerophosphate/cardiolipin synthase-like enzyme